MCHSDDIQQVLIGGGFGRYINVEKAIQIGLLPDLPWETLPLPGQHLRCSGRMHALVSREARLTAEEIARKMTYVELSADNSFMEEYTSGLFLPHTNMAAFPSVEKMLAQRVS